MKCRFVSFCNLNINIIFVSAIKAKSDESLPRPTTPPATPPPEGEMNISVTIDKPEIIMIEDQSKDDTSALMLDVSTCESPTNQIGVI